MVAVLVTGMSGVGKSTVLAELARRGHRVVDTDEPGWIVGVVLAPGTEPEPVWREDRLAALLDAHGDGTLFVGGCVADQRRWYARFDAVVLLSAPLEVVLERVATRVSNPFGRTPAERARIARDVVEVEPLLRAGAGLEIDTARLGVPEVADRIEAVAAVGRRGRPGLRRSAQGTTTVMPAPPPPALIAASAAGASSSPIRRPTSRSGRSDPDAIRASMAGYSCAAMPWLP